MHGGFGLFFKADFLAVQMVEATSHFACYLDVRDLIGTHWYLACAINQNVCALQQGVPKEAIGRQVLILEFFLLIFVGWHALQPADRRHHRQQQVQFGMLGHLRLNKERG